MKSSKDVLLLLVVLIGAAGAGMWVLQMDAQVTPAQEQVAPDVAESGSASILYQPNREDGNGRSLNHTQIKKQFEEIINDFLQDLDTSMGQYRKKRQAVQDIIKPESMYPYDYVQENDIFARTLMAEMEVSMDAMVDQFEKTDNEMTALLSRMRPDDANALLREWKSTKKKQLDEYVSFLIGSARFLICIVSCSRFMSNQGAYTVDLDNGSVAFADRQLQNAYDDAKHRSEELLLRGSDL